MLLCKRELQKTTKAHRCTVFKFWHCLISFTEVWPFYVFPAERGQRGAWEFCCWFFGLFVFCFCFVCILTSMVYCQTFCSFDCFLFSVLRWVFWNPLWRSGSETTIKRCGNDFLLFSPSHLVLCYGRFPQYWLPGWQFNLLLYPLGFSMLIKCFISVFVCAFIVAFILFFSIVSSYFIIPSVFSYI